MKTTSSFQNKKIFNLSPGILFLLSLMLIIEAIQAVLSKDADVYFLLTLGVIPIRFTALLENLPGGSLAIWSSFLTYVFVHGNMSHLIINAFSLIAFGGALEQRIGTSRMLIFFFLCGTLSALCFILFHPDLYAPLIGASGAIAGFLGGLIRIIFSVLNDKQENNVNSSLVNAPLLPIVVAVQDKRIQAVTAAFFLFNLATLLGIQDVNMMGTIAWEAHVGGYIAGFFLIGLFDIASRQTKIDN